MKGFMKDIIKVGAINFIAMVGAFSGMAAGLKLSEKILVTHDKKSEKEDDIKDEAE